jgi:hypothetical protein
MASIVSSMTNPAKKLKGAPKMNEAIFKKTFVISVFCIATLLFVLSIPMTSHGGDPCGDYEISVNVAPNIVNITSQGEGHAVVVHTLQDFTIVNREQTQVFVNDGDNGDCPIADFGQREDDNGHLDIYFLLDDLKDCKGDLEINSEFNILRIEGVDTYENTFCGESYMHIVGKQGPGKP